MKITLNLSQEQVTELIKQLTPVQHDNDYLPSEQTEPIQQPSDYDKKYLTIEGLQHLAKTEYQQFTTQETTILQIANRIRSNELTINPTIDALFVRKIPKQVANTLCNGNSRIMVANNYLASNGKNALPFETAYIKALKNKGFLQGMVSSCNSDIYRALLQDTIQYKVITENKPSNYPSFIQAHPDQLIRAWTIKEGNPNDTHATMLYYTNNTFYCVDTSVLARNTVISMTSFTILHGRIVNHLETLIKP